MPKQLTFQSLEKLNVKHFGGSMLKGNAREARPISLKRPMHLVMRSSLAKGERSFLKRDRKVQELIRRQALISGVRIYRIANSGNHLHLILRPRSRLAFHAFIRAVTGLIARFILSVERGRALGAKFWDAKPFTRIVEWGRDYIRTRRYLEQNTLEAWGFIPVQPRSRKVALQP